MKLQRDTKLSIAKLNWSLIKCVKMGGLTEAEAMKERGSFARIFAPRRRRFRLGR